jgi:riboflavin synthase
MFTGIVTAVGRVAARLESDGVLRLVIEAAYDDLAVGESIAVNGACLTIAEAAAGRFRVDVVGTTLGRTTFGRLAHGAPVNLERAMAAGDRFGGHIVQGHVDGVAEVIAAEATGAAEAAAQRMLRLRVPAEVAETTIPLGSIAVDGVSLTVNAMPEPDVIEVSVIPHTLERTTLGTLASGDRVHVEADVIGKYLRTFSRRG